MPSPLSPGQLTKAPIVEAILGLHFESSELSVAALENWLEAQTEYSTRDTLVENRVDFTTEGTPSAPLETQAHSQIVGFIASCRARNRQLQVRPQALALHQFAPYGSWTTFRDEAQRLFALYRKVNSAPIRGVSLRYINRLELPLENGQLDFRDWLQTRPEIAATFPGQGMSGYFFRVETPQTDIGAVLVFQQGTVPAPEGFAGVLVDCELASQTDFAWNDEVLWQQLELWRERKNSAFWESLAPRARQLLV